LPGKFFINGTNKKYILKKSFERYFPNCFFEKPKQGFGVPVGDWLRDSLKAELLSYINEDFLGEQRLFDIEYIGNIVFNHLNGKIDNTFRVWTFFCFQKWYVHSFNH
jgi:asparagine synthase (glutamine-hydrolysing)